MREVIGRWKDRRVPGGITDHVEIVRSDGADVVVQLSTEPDPRGASTALHSKLPLSRQEMIAFVTSQGW